MRLPLLIALVLCASSASAQRTARPTTPSCPARAVPTPGFAGFASAAGPSTYLAVGQPRRVALRPVSGLRFAAPPERKPSPGAVGAVLPISVARAGTYRVASSAPLWIDMVAGSRRLASSAQSDGARCSGIRKIVEFRLRPGRHTLQLSAPRDRAGAGDAAIMIVRR